MSLKPKSDGAIYAAASKKRNPEGHAELTRTIKEEIDRMSDDEVRNMLRGIKDITQ